MIDLMHWKTDAEFRRQWIELWKRNAAKAAAERQHNMLREVPLDSKDPRRRQITKAMKKFSGANKVGNIRETQHGFAADGFKTTGTRTKQCEPIGLIRITHEQLAEYSK